MAPFPFHGYPSYVEDAAKGLGRPFRVAGVSRIGALVAVANLCAQASVLTPSRISEVLEKAKEFRDQLEVALVAADAMLNDLNQHRVQLLKERLAPRPVPEPEPGPEVPVESPSRPAATSAPTTPVTPAAAERRTPQPQPLPTRPDPRR